MKFSLPILLTAVALTALSGTLSGCRTSSNPVPFTLTQAEPFSGSWPEAFSRPVGIRVTPLLTAEIQVDRAILVDPACDAPDAPEDVWVPVLAYLVEHPSFGAFLLDAGAPRVNPLMKWLGFAKQAEATDTRALLEELGVEPESLRMILLSHMHVDHVMALPDLPQSVPVVTGSGAIGAYETMMGLDFLSGRAEILELPGVVATGDVMDLFGDASFFVLGTPGHTPGNLSFIVNGRGGPVLLTHDASHLRYGFDRGCGPGKVVDRAAADASLEWLRTLSRRSPELRVRAGHDAAEWDLSRGVQTAP